jgi:hypothetical protein
MNARWIVSYFFLPAELRVLKVSTLEVASGKNTG